MLINAVLLLNAVSALWGGRLLFKQTRNYATWLFEVVFAVFFVIRPLAISSLGLLTFDLVRFRIGNEAVLTYVLCGLLFSIVFHWTVCRLYGKPRLFTDRIFRVCNFDDVGRRRFAYMFLLFLVLTYAVNTYKYDSLTYFARNLDSFEAMMRLAQGRWYVEVLSGVLIFPVVAFLARNLNAKPAKLVCLLILAMVSYSVIVRPSTRTATISLLVAVATYSFSVGKIRVRLVSVAVTLIAVIGLLVFLDFVRQGNIQAEGQQISLLSILNGAFLSAVSADNGMILIDYLTRHSWLYFRFLLPALCPLFLVPSAIFPFKPRADLESVLTWEIFGSDLDPATYREGSTLTYTVPVAGYADLSFVGVLIAALIYGFLFSAFLRGWKSKSVTVRFVTLFYLILMIGGLRLTLESVVLAFYWNILATWSMHLVCHFHFFGKRIRDRGQVGDSTLARG